MTRARSRKPSGTAHPATIIAILFGVAEADRLIARVEASRAREMSVASYVEAGTVLAGRRIAAPEAAAADLDALLSAAAIVLVPVDVRQAQIALAARIRFGRGFGHGAGLSFGDCFAYALAMVRKARLPLVGDDFARTDLRSASS